MRKIFNLKIGLLILGVLVSFLSKAEAKVTGPGEGLNISTLVTCLSDTIPAVTTTTEVKEEAPKKKIKKIPRSRKQVKPISVDPTLPVKPIKIIKPKIIRRTVGSVGL